MSFEKEGPGVGNEELFFNGFRVSVWKSSGDGWGWSLHNSVNAQSLMPLNNTLKNGGEGKSCFVCLCYLYFTTKTKYIYGVRTKLRFMRDCLRDMLTTHLSRFDRWDHWRATDPPRAPETTDSRPRTGRFVLTEGKHKTRPCERQRSTWQTTLGKNSFLCCSVCLLFSLFRKIHAPQKNLSF